MGIVCDTLLRMKYRFLLHSLSHTILAVNITVRWFKNQNVYSGVPATGSAGASPALTGCASEIGR